MRTSLYADDAAIFLNPAANELSTVHAILQCLGRASGLITNIDKKLGLPNLLQPSSAKAEVMTL